MTKVISTSPSNPRSPNDMTTTSAASGGPNRQIFRQCLADHRPAGLRDRPLRRFGRRGRSRRRARRQGRMGANEPAERAQILLKIADRMEANLEKLALAETWDNGKPIRESTAADIPLAIDHFRYFASAIRAQEGSLSEIDHDTVAYHFHEPLGVVGQIIPWNFPILMACWKPRPRWPRETASSSSPPSKLPPRSWCGSRSSATCCPRACSTSSTGSASKPASRSPPRTASPRSPSPARRRPAGSSCNTRRRT